MRRIGVLLVILGVGCASATPSGGASPGSPSGEFDTLVARRQAQLRALQQAKHWCGLMGREVAFNIDGKEQARVNLPETTKDPQSRREEVVDDVKIEFTADRDQCVVRIDGEEAHRSNYAPASCAKQDWDACLKESAAAFKETGASGALAGIENACPGHRPACSTLLTIAAENVNVLGNPVGSLDPETLAAIYKVTCDAGEPAGCEKLASALFFGAGVQKNLSEARRLHLKSCEAGIPVACVNAAGDFAMGNGGEPDLAMAAQLNEKGCKLGNVGGCLHAGWEFMYGRAIDQDIPKALDLLRIGCERGHQMSCDNLAHAEKMKSARALQRPCDSKRWKECADAAKVLWGIGPSKGPYEMAKSACKGDPKTCDALAWMAWQVGTGSGTMQASPKLGLEMLTFACENQRGKACVDLSRHYRSGDWGPKDFIKMAELDQLTCTAGLAEGCRFLAWDYRDGRGVEQDPKRSRDLLRQACKQNNADACSELAGIYYNGEGVPRDREQARSLYQRACSLGSASIACERAR